jgi:SAM-dependent methyltransferase
MTDRLYDDPDLVQFYDAENGWDESNDFCRNLVGGSASVLDLGCGTGLLAAALATEGQRRVVAVDRARPMLEIARRRDRGDRVRWIEADARTVRLDERFDLVVLTGHAFQVFLTDADRAAVLRTIAHHLAPEGRFVFDSRNPAAEEWKEWTPDRSRRVFHHPVEGEVQAWNDVAYDVEAAVATYETHYRIVRDGRVLSSQSGIAFPSRDDLSRALDAAGLLAEKWLGDWSGTPWHSRAPEIIPIGRRRGPQLP